MLPPRATAAVVDGRQWLSCRSRPIRANGLNSGLAFSDATRALWELLALRVLFPLCADLDRQRLLWSLLRWVLLLVRAPGVVPSMLARRNQSLPGRVAAAAMLSCVNRRAGRAGEVKSARPVGTARERLAVEGFGEAVDEDET